jgi:hypothetical protein
MGIAISNIRTEGEYILTNYGETFEFKVVRIVSDNEFLLRDLTSLDEYMMSELTGQGKGPDFSIWER